MCARPSALDVVVEVASLSKRANANASYNSLFGLRVGEGSRGHTKKGPSGPCVCVSAGVAR